MSEWFDMFTHGDAGPITIESGFLVMLLAFCIGHVIAWIYMGTHSGLSYSQMFTSSLLVMPVIVALVMLLMAGNLIVAIGLFAVIAVVKFRNVLKDTRDTSFILWAIVEGMAVGTMRFGTALLGAVFIALIFLYLRFTSFGGRHRYDVILSLQVASGSGETGQGAAGVLKQVLRRHSVRAHLASQRELDESNVDLSYRLLLRDPSRSRELINELQATPGIARVSLYHREDESEI
jgi:hypothetical protein